MLFTVFLLLIIGFGWFLAEIYQNSSILVLAVILSIAASFSSYWFSDKLVLAMAKAVPVSREEYFDLYTVTENLCITAGLPLPRIYIIEEMAPNAFATGRDPKHAVIAVTRGLLSKLNRVELEGGIAHELSHVGNRDMLVSTMIVVMVGIISITADMFLRSRWRFGGERHRGNANQILFLAGIIVVVLAPLAATLMRLAISRKREFLADASGALLTRYPEGLAGALIKISSDATQMSIVNNATAHLWLDNPFRGRSKASFWTKLFLTHPPIEERVKALRDFNLST